MFFVLSKVLWFFVVPLNVLFLLLVIGAPLLWTRWQRIGRWLISVAAAFAIFLVLVPVGGNFSLWLENRFPSNPQLPEKVDGIVVLGGALQARISAKRNTLALSSSVERIVEFGGLAEKFPSAKLIFTGGSGSLLDQEFKEADYATPFLRRLGVAPERVIFENQSRNTYENATFSFDLAAPKDGETWVLITSAAHMPRAVGCFRKAGWSGLIPYPVDYSYAGDETFGPPLTIGSGSGRISKALHELLGLTFYYLTGKTDALFPAP